MNQGDATVFLSQLFGSVEGVTFEVIDLALTRSRVVDSLGRAPVDPSWEPTFDEWLAAADIADQMALKGAMIPTDALTQFTSEGATFHFAGAAADWAGISAHLRSRSTLTHGTGWAMVEVPSEASTFHPRSEAWL